MKTDELLCCIGATLAFTGMAVMLFGVGLHYRSGPIFWAIFGALVFAITAMIAWMWRSPSL